VRTFTFASLLTTGPSPGEDAVVEVAALRADGKKVTEKFQRLANPGAVTAAFCKFSGLCAKELAGQPEPAHALRALLEFCGDDCVVVYDQKRFCDFFEAAGEAPPKVCDALRLANIVLPQASDYRLLQLAGQLSCDLSITPRAPSRTVALAAVWLAMLEKLQEFPGPVLDVIYRLLEAALDPLAEVLRHTADASDFELKDASEDALQRLFSDHSQLLREAQRFENPKPTEKALPTEELCAMFGPDAVVGRHLSAYEHRAEQVQMVEAVCEAFNEPHHLMVEAGTGTGKSMAYLLPAIAWSCTNDEKVVVSTNTRNLQEQLYQKDLPFLSKLLPGRFDAALLKGRRNYLCIRRFLHTVGHYQLELSEPEEYLALASLVSWAGTSKTGDISECNGFSVSEGSRAVLPTVVAGSEECAGRACPHRNQCFVRRARALAQLADVIVVNHALLFAEIGTPVLPPYRCVIFDEAQNVEDVATDAFAVGVNTLSIYRPTNLLYRQRGDGAGSGLLSSLMYEARSSNLPEKAASELLAAAGAAMEQIDDVTKATRQFFELLAMPFEEIPPNVDRLLLCECQPDLGTGTDAWDGAGRLRESIRSLGSAVEKVSQMLDELAEDSKSLASLAHDLRGAMEQLRQVSESIEFVLLQDDEQFVYWLERHARQHRTFYSIHAAPLQIERYMRDFFFSEKRTVIFTSATLQVDGDFDYMLRRLGAQNLPPGHIHSIAVGSPFDYDRQALVGVTTFLPDPGGRRDRAFDTQLADFLADLLQVTHGRAMVLFTSYSLLESVYKAVKQPLERAGITVLAQGHSGSRQAITDFFRSVPSSVLLGTRSFWEGVDIAGETLSCLVLTKLPFHVFTDPLVRGRMGYMEALGLEPFMNYTLPEAVINFRQGFGRLIRRGTDKGVIIVADRRMVTKGYGRIFLSSLPTRHQVFKTRDEALRTVEAFFASEG